MKTYTCAGSPIYACHLITIILCVCSDVNKPLHLEAEGQYYLGYSYQTWCLSGFFKNLQGGAWEIFWLYIESIEWFIYLALWLQYWRYWNVTE